MLHSFVLCFVPLFVAVDVFGVLPLFLGMTASVAAGQRRHIIWQSLLTALAVALAFVGLGRAVLALLGITVEDFMIAGGVLLFVFSMNELLALDSRRRSGDPDSLGVVPIGVPLITGPAVLTTSLLLLNEHGPLPTVAALVLNIALVGVVFFSADQWYRILGKSGTKALSKIASLLLAAIAVMMVRKGLVSLLAGVHAAAGSGRAGGCG